MFLYEKISPFSSEQEGKGRPSAEVLAGTWEGLEAGKTGVLNKNKLVMTQGSRPSSDHTSARKLSQICPAGKLSPSVCGQGPALWAAWSALCWRVARSGAEREVVGKLERWRYRTLPWSCPFSHLGLHMHIHTMGALDQIAVRQNRLGTVFASHMPGADLRFGGLHGVAVHCYVCLLVETNWCR